MGTSPPCRPGSVCRLLAADAGGYDDELGWTGDVEDKPTPCPARDGSLDKYAANRLSHGREWQTLAAHTAMVGHETARLAAALGLFDDETRALRAAALWHDVGKAHPDFQKMLRDGSDSGRRTTPVSSTPSQGTRRAHSPPPGITAVCAATNSPPPSLGCSITRTTLPTAISSPT